MKRQSAAMAFSLVALAGASAEANLKMTLDVGSCAEGNAWQETENRVGRLTITDQIGGVAYTQENVAFTTGQCKANFTISLSPALLVRFLNPDDPLFVTLEGCKNAALSCPFNGAQLDAHPLVFANQSIDSVLPDLARLQSDANTAEVNRATAAELALSSSLSSEIARAKGAEQVLGTNLSSEVNRATAAELALSNGLDAESVRATAAEQALGVSLSNESGRAMAAESAEIAARMRAVSDEAQTRAQGDLAERDYADVTFLKNAGGTVEGDLTVNGVLRIRGGISWDRCPEGLDALEHTFDAYQGTTNRLCASEPLTTAPSVQIKQVIASYIEPICPMVIRVTQNYAQIGGPAAINGVNVLLGKVGTLLTSQILPFTTDLLQAGTGKTNEAVDQINNAIAAINASLASTTTTINASIDAYNGLVAGINGALVTETGGINGVINGVNSGFSGLHSAIGVAVAGVNLAVGDVNAAFSSVNTSLGTVSNTVNTLNNAGALNTALAALDLDINNRIDGLNVLIDSINATQVGTVNGINGAIGGINAGFSTVNSAVGGVVAGINNGVIAPFNGNVDAATEQARVAANYVLGFAIAGAQQGVNGVVDAVNNAIIGPQDCNVGGTLNAILCSIDDIIDVVNEIPLVELAHMPWGPRIHSYANVPNNGHIFALDVPGHVGNLAYHGAAPQVNNVGAPAALAHLSHVPSHAVGSLGLPALHLGLAASMRTISYGGSTPQLATVVAPHISGANLNALPAPVLPTVPHMQAPVLPAFSGFSLIGAVDFNQVSGLIGDAVSPVCNDIQSTADGYLQAFVGQVPALVPSFKDAEEVCGSRGAHVCSETEIGILADDGTPSAVGFAFGDWAGEGRVILNDHATTGLLLAVDWPFIHVDASKLLSFPPAWPFTFTPPVVPTGRFRCCASSSTFH